VQRERAALLNKISGRVGSGQPNSYRAKKKQKNLLFSAIIAMTAMTMAAAIRNPPRHRYSVAFFQISATPNRHGTAIAAIRQH